MSTTIENIQSEAKQISPKEMATDTVASYSTQMRYLVFSTVVIYAAWLGREGTYYTPGSTIGYYLGLVGSVFMLILMFYPLVKRLRFMHYALPARYWFRVHMFFGISGPIFILFHSTMRINSFNGGVVFLCMLLVFVSGIFGRFIYPRFTTKLYEHRVMLDTLKHDLGITGEEARSKFHNIPQLESRLVRLETYILNLSSTLPGSLWLLLSLRPRLLWTSIRAKHELKKAIKHYARKKHWDRQKFHQKLKYGRKIVHAYLRTIRQVARFSRYERLSSFWRVIHIPLNFLLVVTGIVHVLAVHMY